MPSAEAVIRQVLYGNEFFRKEFGKESVDFMLPDCFGFPASMPSIWAHCGLIGFSTQKLTWGSAVGIPFKIGVWEGPDGKGVIAALDPGPYVGGIEGRVDTNPQWVERVEKNGERYGVYADYHYYGVGDQGAPREKDVANYLASIGNPDGKIIVALTSSDQMYKDITAEQRARLPRYKGDMLLTEHSAGTLTSQSYMKRWNRKNELLADAAERVAVAAHQLGRAEYPREKINKAWVRTLANQMHDILPGTSIPEAYTFSWNDEIVASNLFAAVLSDSIGGIASQMDTTAKGIPVIVYNPLAIEREDVAEAEIHFGSDLPKSVCVFDSEGRERPSQVISTKGSVAKVLFLAKVPSVGLAVYDVRMAEEGESDAGGLKVSKTTLENDHYRVTVNKAGDVASIIDKKNGNRELLAKPAQLVFTYERPAQWPAWNMDWADRQKPPIDVVKGPVEIEIVERGPLRVALEIRRKARNSYITQRIRLSSGSAGERIEFANEIDWQSAEVALKASFPLAASNPKATYNWGMGTIERGNNEKTKYEVPSHEWFDLTDKSGDFGVTVLEDSKFGSDKPADNEVRLTLLYTPGVRSGYLDQHSQDWGRHEILYGLYGHDDDWRGGRSEWQGRRLNQPLATFQAPSHKGLLGRTYSSAIVNTPQVDIRAIKLAERDDWTIVRVQELWGHDAKNVTVSFANPIAAAYEVNGQERRIADFSPNEGKLVFDLTPFSPRSFAVKFGNQPSANRNTSLVQLDLDLDFDTDLFSFDSNRADGAIDAEGRTFPAEELPSKIVNDGIEFKLGSTAEGQMNAISCDGQLIDLPPPNGAGWQLNLLITAEADTTGEFLIGESVSKLPVQSWTGFVGQFDNRIWDRPFEEVDFKTEGNVIGFKTGYIKRDDIAWFCTHRHHPKQGNEAYQFSYLYHYRLTAGPEATTITLPKNKKIKLLAVTRTRVINDVVIPARPLYDDFTGRKPIELRHVYPLPPKPVFEGVTAVGKVTLDRKDSFESLSMGPPSTTDYADAASKNGVKFKYFDVDGKYRPHGSSGAVDGVFVRLNDGEAARKDDDTKRCVWYDGEGRFYCDLGKPLAIDRVNTFSWHRSNRALQNFSLWGSTSEKMPSAEITHEKHDGWTLLGVVNSKELGEGGIHGSTVTGANGALGEYRWLLWVAQNMGEGTFFTEIDVIEAK
ncbi:MAG: alpha-mannosidase [Planctomycetes bacterium]|nr:alpha-mannosidase [Planctomycetota bacterium]